MRKLCTGVLLLTAARLAITPVVAQESGEYRNQNKPASEIGSTDAEVAQAENYEWVTVSGRTRNVTADGFLLDYGGGEIRVEMDDFDGYRHTFGLEEGQHVMVSGQIDADMMETRTIEARWVYDNGSQKYHFSNNMDEEDHVFGRAQPEAMLAADGEWLSVTGRIVSIGGDQLTLDIGARQIAVDLDRIEDELDVEAGDRVSVYGQMDDADFWEGREIIAESVAPVAEG